jgi:hypothetical protein
MKKVRAKRKSVSESKDVEPQAVESQAMGPAVLEARYVGPFAEGQVKMKHYPKGIWLRVSGVEAEHLKTIAHFEIRERQEG